MAILCCVAQKAASAAHLRNLEQNRNRFKCQKCINPFPHCYFLAYNLVMQRMLSISGMATKKFTKI
jgi:hypothetical protein